MIREKHWFGIGEAARRLGVCTQTIYNAIWKGKIFPKETLLSSVKSGQKYFFTQEILDEFLAQQDNSPKQILQSIGFTKETYKNTTHPVVITGNLFFTKPPAPTPPPHRRGRLNISLPPEVAHFLKEIAAKNGRSATQQNIYFLLKCFQIVGNA